jgi:hypothetical protein
MNIFFLHSFTFMRSGSPKPFTRTTLIYTCLTPEPSLDPVIPCKNKSWTQHQDQTGMEILIKRCLTGRVLLGRAIIPGQKQWQPILGIEFHATNEKSHDGVKGRSLLSP